MMSEPAALVCCGVSLLFFSHVLRAQRRFSHLIRLRRPETNSPLTSSGAYEGDLQGTLDEVIEAGERLFQALEWELVAAQRFATASSEDMRASLFEARSLADAAAEEYAQAVQHLRCAAVNPKLEAQSIPSGPSCLENT